VDCTDAMHVTNAINAFEYLGPVASARAGPLAILVPSLNAVFIVK